MRDLASAATNFRQKPCKLLLISSQLESICKIKVGKYKIQLTVFKVLVFLLRFLTYFFSYLTSFESIDCYNLIYLPTLVIIIYSYVTNTHMQFLGYLCFIFRHGVVILFALTRSNKLKYSKVNIHSLLFLQT